jgi:hypothetical protein
MEHLGPGSSFTFVGTVSMDQTAEQIYTKFPDRTFANPFPVHFVPRETTLFPPAQLWPAGSLFHFSSSVFLRSMPVF